MQNILEDSVRELRNLRVLNNPSYAKDLKQSLDL